jgi:hypothetical protein
MYGNRRAVALIFLLFSLVVIVDSKSQVKSENANEKTEEDEILSPEEEKKFLEKNVISDLPRGLGNEIKWIKIRAALEINLREAKPVMVIFHKPWCGACQSKS